MPDDAAILDLDELQEVYDGPALRALLAQAQQHLHADTEAIAAELASGAHIACRASTHRLKSMTMFLAGQRLRADFERLEDALREERAATGPAWQALRLRLGRLDVELAGVLARLPRS
jgi:hypothetical protein